ncbi:MAG: hypothetical protein ACOYMZ_03565 [Minisyncoccia bacterium]
MKITKGKINIDSSRDLYWSTISILSDDGAHQTHIYVCSSEEYLRANFPSKSNESITEDTLNSWLDSVIQKWSVLGDNIFDQGVHYDIYTMTADGESKGLEFLFNLTK